MQCSQIENSNKNKGFKLEYEFASLLVRMSPCLSRVYLAMLDYLIHLRSPERMWMDVMVEMDHRNITSVWLTQWTAKTVEVDETLKLAN
ncbi:hypothetical protein SERLA73DRAFT_145105 [Serpula lacrymans var. lacrymans S7.3]|uniref:Uncharacterized protein n=2 Tax=Serpula lacrymans var. lacrymans TaxID=341189 RepID=F8QD16_SERL3|nr:uncharacterized protein SERLADRAFT_402908 [Serpula lacrymans var. lacrymans S7.9]EGN94031.1 hypothetical protein SERLA73DRAFT_145105 [Serpula lacrymans var. lacrymans S7.3]EGO19383.1 hypothetical protein SERLADRAFT_402908 [Serpula lacrymans var. lacrymans S7.9]